MKSSELLRILRRDGWYVISQKGSHLRLVHAIKKNTVFVPYHGAQEVGKGLERKILKEAGIL
ncbi:MAG: type II toxin-antitoxin system HicA family toxin [Bacteroidales bacterium]|nr:type II toxin-antitoxin system HicA family toxin [Bacteroidales bacterium]